MLLVPFFASGCIWTIDDAALCDGTRAARDAHSAALLADGGPRSLATGARLIGLVDAGCGDTR